MPEDKKIENDLEWCRRHQELLPKVPTCVTMMSKGKWPDGSSMSKAAREKIMQRPELEPYRDSLERPLSLWERIRRWVKP
jgi:hypothetical protein